MPRGSLTGCRVHMDAKLCQRHSLLTWGMLGFAYYPTRSGP